MNREHFKEEYLTDAFFFVENEEQFNKIQEIAVEFGLLNPIGSKDFIKYDMYNVSKNIAPEPGIKVVKNLTIFPNNRFQQSEFWIRDASYGKPKCYEQFLNDYHHLVDQPGRK